MGRIAQWDGKAWDRQERLDGADQDVIWNMIKAASDEFKKSGK